jgi:hypothetical protein
MCVDLFSFIFSFNFRNHVLMFCWCSWSLREAVADPGWEEKMAVPSANVLSVVLLDVGRSAVYIVYSSGPRMLPWGTPENIGNRDEV